ncbi:MAG: hypothetical protein IPL55_20930 [Saprospiraceae bacterium]|jgi:poly(3-hydroxybutyrate) depolymerase|nr:hypothetical protein [Saprospiraceae bacterium]MBL0026695.1 hypothetical protein [Saprospiraceae bacterium]
MLHGTGGNGTVMYDNSGFKEIGESENILRVITSSLRRCIINEGVQETTAKWNSQPAENWFYCAYVAPHDDVKFLKEVLIVKRN